MHAGLLVQAGMWPVAILNNVLLVVREGPVRKRRSRNEYICVGQGWTQRFFMQPLSHIFMLLSSMTLGSKAFS
jgi:hypothetical protein